ncbi:hypothetical protein [Microbacterium testaceum]|uniref:hypothetical protein n=1 Tax=Microbacterium testaceum TaxID=2033 RepID=UPI0022E8AA43|nr:hypothetical protein [Microbacterium testaceum]
MSARHDFPRSVREHAENAADHADSAARIMNDAKVPDFRDRAFEELCFAIIEMSRAVEGLDSSARR